MRAQRNEVIPMKRAVLLLFLVSVLFGVGHLYAQQAPEIRYTSVPDLLKLPPDVYLGEAAGVAVNSKGHVFVFSRGNSAGPGYGASAAQLLEFDADGKFVREIGHIFTWSFARGARGQTGQHLGC